MNVELQSSIINFKFGLVNKMRSLDINPEIILEISDYIDLQDITSIKAKNGNEGNKHRRAKKNVPTNEQCNASKIDGGRCTRRKKFDTQFCGTHLKCSTYTEFKYIDNINPIIDKIVSAIDVKGIIYYIDNELNVYNTEDVINKLIDPKIIGKAIDDNGIYTIPSLGLV